MVKKYKLLFFLNILWIAIYFFVFFELKIPISDEIMFFTSDAQEYLATSREFYNFTATGRSITRPFLFPLLILIFYSTSTPFFLWLFQFVCWILSLNLLFAGIQKISESKILAFIGSLLLASNLTYIVLTFHALTEVLTLFLLSWLLYLLAINAKKLASLKSFNFLLFIIILLTVLKPLFFIPLIFVLLIVFPVFFLRNYLSHPKKLLFLFLLFLPLFYQLSLMKFKYNTFTVSTVSSLAIRNYITAQSIQENNPNIAWETAQLKARNFTNTEFIDYCFANKSQMANLYLQNLGSNIKAYPYYLANPITIKHDGFERFMTKLNRFYFNSHLLFVLPILVFFFVSYRKKENNLFAVITVRTN